MNDDFRFEQHPDGGYESDQLRDALDSLQGDLPIISSPPQARVYNNANIATTTGASTVLTFNSERWDNADIHSTSANTSRLTAPLTGLYAMGACATFAANSTGSRLLNITLNGAAVIAEEKYPATPAASGSTILGVETQYRLVAGDYVEAFVVQDSGGNLNVTSNANFSPEFWICRLGSYGS